MSHTHAVVWLDFKEAHIFLFNAEDVERKQIKAHAPSHKVHQKAGVVGSGHTTTTPTSRASSPLWRAPRAGWSPGRPRPRTSWRATSRSTLKSQLIGVEPMDHPTDGELVDHARRFFKAADKMKAG